MAVCASNPHRVGGAGGQLCPGISDVDLFRDSEGIVDFNAQVPNGAFDLRSADVFTSGAAVGAPPPELLERA